MGDYFFITLLLVISEQEHLIKMDWAKHEYLIVVQRPVMETIEYIEYISCASSHVHVSCPVQTKRKQDSQLHLEPDSVQTVWSAAMFVLAVTDQLWRPS